MAEGSNEEYTRFLAQPSSNMDDSGFFSVQVILKALEVYGLTAQHWNHPDLSQARKHPAMLSAFIFNLDQHWFTIRKIGLQWFNIDSCKSGPVLISDTYLEVYLKQLELEGYTIFVVHGKLPECAADTVLAANPVDPATVNSTSRSRDVVSSAPAKPAPVVTESVEDIRRKRLARFEGESADSTAAGITAASEESARLQRQTEVEDEELARAIALSMQDSY